MSFEQHINTIICGDCLQVMADWPGGCANLVLTDPPYPDYSEEKFRFNYKDGTVNILENFICRQFVFWSAKADFPLDYTATHIWDKTTRCRSEYERIFERQGGRKQKMFRYHCISNKIDAQLMKDIFTNHPTQKPIRLLLDMVARYSKPNDLILDPFCGSGTTCVAAKMLGRRFIGIDISSEYCEIARQRLRAVETGVPVKEQKIGQMVLFSERNHDED